jgi:SAM-dependent methyltransferase
MTVVVASPWPEGLFVPSSIEADTTDTALLRTVDGGALELDIARWHDGACEDDIEIVARARGPVLDVGCGPGRLLEVLARCGIEAAGIDSSPAAIGTSLSRGGDAYLVDAFDAVPREGEWATVLLLDGNIGIGGDVTALLTRVVELLRPGGDVIVEVHPPGACSTNEPLSVRVEWGDEVGPWFPWTRASADGIVPCAERAGLRLSAKWHSNSRWFVVLHKPLGHSSHGESR